MNKLSRPPGRKQATLVMIVGNYANSAIALAQGLLLVPLYLIYLGAFQYGIWLSAFGVLSVLAVMNFGINAILTQRISAAYGQSDAEKVGTYLASGLLINFGTIALFVVAGVFLSFGLPAILNTSGSESQLLVLSFQIAVVGTGLSFLNEFLRSFSTSLLRPTVPMIGMAVGRIAGICTIAALLVAGYGLPAIAIGLLTIEVVGLATNLVNSAGLFRVFEIRLRFNRAATMELLKTSPMIFLARLSTTASHEIEPLLITLFIAPEVTAAYMIARRMADMLNQLLSIIAGSVLGTFSHLAGQNDRQRVVQVARDLIVFTLMLCVVGYAVYVSANNSFIRLWVGESLVVDQAIILAVGVGYLAKTFKGMPYQILYGLSEFNYVSIVTIAEGIIRLSLSFALLGTLGVIGLPLALVASNSLSAGVLLNKLRTRLDVEVSCSRVIRMAIFGGIAFALGPILAMLNIPIDSWVGLIIFIIVATTLIGAATAAMNHGGIVDLYRRRLAR